MKANLDLKHVLKLQIPLKKFVQKSDEDSSQKGRHQGSCIHIFVNIKNVSLEININISYHNIILSQCFLKQKPCWINKHVKNITSQMELMDTVKTK